MLRRILATVGSAAVVTAGALATAVPASADPLPQFQPFAAPDMAATGDHAFCHGMIHVDLSYDRAKPGITTVTVSSPGFTGTGTEWTADPMCRVGLMVSWEGGDTQTNIPLSFGEGPQKPVATDITTGFGANLISFSPVHNEGPVPMQSGTGFGTYTFLPWW